MKLKTKHLLFLAGGALLGWWLVKKADQQSGLSGLGESNPLVGPPKTFTRNRWMRSWGSANVLRANTPRTPLVELDDVRGPAVTRFVVTDAGLEGF